MPHSPSRSRRSVLRVAFAVALVFLACSEPLILIPDPVQVRVGGIERADLERTLAALSGETDERARLLAGAFREAGCPEDRLQQLPGTRGASVICTLPGASPWTILVGANVDPPPEGSGIVDNGTGMALLPLLYAAVAVEPRRHTFVFAGFTDTLLKQRGARRYLREVGSEGRDRIRAMIQLKALGLGTPAMWGAQADPNLRQDLFSVSRALDLPLRNVGFQENVALDAKAFRAARIPTLTLHSLDRGSARLLTEPHRGPGLEGIDWENYQAAARMLAFYLAYLDLTLQLRVDSQPELAEPEAAPPSPL